MITGSGNTFRLSGISELIYFDSFISPQRKLLPRYVWIHKIEYHVGVLGSKLRNFISLTKTLPGIMPNLFFLNIRSNK